MGINDAQLRKILTELKYISAEDLKRAELGMQPGDSLYDSLLKKDIITDSNLGKIIAYSLQLPFVSLEQSSIPEEILKLLPQELAMSRSVIPFALEGGVLRLATSDPDQQDLFEMLAKKAGAKEFRVCYATLRDIQDALRLYKKDLSTAFEGLLASKAEGSDPKDVPVAEIVNTLLEYAYINKVSDVHVEATRTNSLIRYRIDGVLHDVMILPRILHDQLVTRIKVMARLRTDEHFGAQDGRMRVKVDEEEMDVRVSIVPVVTGEKVVMRLLASHNRQFGLTDLGMRESDLKKVRAAFMRPYGMVLSTGPTGSGKTTSMYAVLKILNTREKNIATIEDPVEYEISGINQIQANPKTNLTFANGLRSILRQDPDIIYVGEIRDEETASIAINSAMTGHLVLSTLHTNDAATALPRLIDMGIEPFLVASTVNAIIGQRLIRQICNTCKVSFEVKKSPTGWKGGDVKTATLVSTMAPALRTKYFGTSTSIRLYKGKGCQVCHGTGYLGRVGIFEILQVSTKVQELITQKADAAAIKQQAVTEGMTTMLDDGLAKVQQGLTTFEEVMRVTR